MEQRYPTLTEEAIDEARAMIGVPLRRRPHHTQANRDVLLRYAKGLGCRNPLYSDLAYGTLNTHWAALLGHPTVLFSFDTTVVAPKLAGIHSIYAGVSFEWFRQIRAGDRISATAMLTGVEEKEGEFCGPMVLQTGEVRYVDGEDHLIAIARPRVLRTPRDEARRRGKYAGLRRHEYGQEEFEAIMSAYATEHVQGSRPLYFEDVGVSDELPSVVKGPLTTEDMNFFVGEVAETLFFQEFVTHLRRHPADAYWHPDNNMPDSWDSSLLLDAPAQEFGFPTAHDTGLQRVAWLELLITNWMGDLAFLRRLDVRLTRPFLHADTAWLSGRVTSKRWIARQPRVEVAVEVANQRGEVTALGTAEVELPCKDFDVPQPGLIMTEGAALNQDTPPVPAEG